MKIIALNEHVFFLQTYDSRKKAINATNNSISQSNSNTTAAIKSSAEQFEKASKCMNKLIEYASQLNRNIILDQVNRFIN